MDADQTLKILKMVQEGFLTPEQGQRLIQELIAGTPGESSTTQDARPMPPPPSDTTDLFRMVEDAGKTFTQGFEKLFGFASQTVKDTMGLGPQNVILKVLDAEGVQERYQVTIPFKIFTALKPLLIHRPPVVVHPIQQIDYESLFQSLESGQTGRVFEYVDHTRGDRLEVWVQ
jgi:hypothetical protein